MIVSKEIEKLYQETDRLWSKVVELQSIIEVKTYGLTEVTEEDLLQLIRESIKEQGITQTRISEITGYARATLSMSLRGKRRMPIEVMLKCLELIGWKLVAVPKELPFTPEGEEDGC